MAAEGTFTWHEAGDTVPPGIAGPLVGFARSEADHAGVALCLVLSADGSLLPGIPEPARGWHGFATLRNGLPEVWLNLAAPPLPVPTPAELAAGVRRTADEWGLSAAMCLDSGVDGREDGLLADLFHATADRQASWDTAALPGTDPSRATVAHEIGHLLCRRLQEAGVIPSDGEGLRHWLAGGSRGQSWHPDVPGDWDSCPCCVHAVAEYREPAEWFAEAWAMLRCGHRDELARFGPGLVARLGSLPGTGP